MIVCVCICGLRIKITIEKGTLRLMVRSGSYDWFWLWVYAAVLDDVVLRLSRNVFTFAYIKRRINLLTTTELKSREITKKTKSMIENFSFGFRIVYGVVCSQDLVHDTSTTFLPASTRRSEFMDSWARGISYYRVDHILHRRKDDSSAFCSLRFDFLYYQPVTPPGPAVNYSRRKILCTSSHNIFSIRRNRDEFRCFRIIDQVL